MSADGNVSRPMKGTVARPSSPPSASQQATPTVRMGSRATAALRTASERTSPTMRLVSLTQRFFQRGEEQEATGYKNVILDADDAPESRPEFDSFDKIPRRRRPLLLVAGLIVLGVVGVSTWRSFHGLRRPGSSVEAASRALVAAPPVAIDPPAAAATVPAPSHEIAAPAPAPAPVIEPIASAAEPPAVEAPAPRTIHHFAEPDPARTAAAPAAAATEPAPPAPRAADAEDRESSSPASRASAKPLRGYVWSPAAKRLIPASDDQETASKVTDRAQYDSPPAVIPGDEAPSAPTTAPQPFEPSSAPKAPIIE